MLFNSPRWVTCFSFVGQCEALSVARTASLQHIQVNNVIMDVVVHVREERAGLNISWWAQEDEVHFELKTNWSETLIILIKFCVLDWIRRQSNKEHKKPLEGSVMETTSAVGPLHMQTPVHVGSYPYAYMFSHPETKSACSISAMFEWIPHSHLLGVCKLKSSR